MPGEPPLKPGADAALRPLPAPRRAGIEAALALAVEIPAALLVAVEIVVLFAGVIARFALGWYITVM